MLTNLSFDFSASDPDFDPGDQYSNLIQGIIDTRYLGVDNYKPTKNSENAQGIT